MPQGWEIKKASPSRATVERVYKDQLLTKRSEIRGQLEELTNRRNELAGQRTHATVAQAKELDVRISAIDQRSALLESELFAVNDQISRGIVPDAITSVKVIDASQAVPPSFDPGFLAREVQIASRQAVFSAAFGVFAMYLVWRGIRRIVGPKRPAVVDNSAQLIQLQQSMDVIALEVERISEAQRYTARLLSEKSDNAADVPSGRR